MPDTFSARKPVILAVDDAVDTLSMMSAILEKAGMTALVAQDGKSALALLEHALPDLILMDAMMPRMDGFAAARTLKGDARFAHIPVIFLTGLAEPENVVKGFDSGGVDYITKPIVPEVMLARVRAHLSNARLTQSARGDRRFRHAATGGECGGRGAMGDAERRGPAGQRQLAHSAGAKTGRDRGGQTG
jgi:DNA-binding response OmpR family regulator